MNLYDQLKSNLTPRCVTERYGPPIHRGDMICCPFHEDRTPSLHVYADASRGWFCFGCRRGGTLSGVPVRGSAVPDAVMFAPPRAGWS